MATRKMTKTNTATTEVKEKVEEKVVETKPVEKQKKKFEQSDGILCRSVTQGLLLFEGSNTGMLYRWDDYGDVQEVEYRDLVSAVRTRKSYIFEPYFIIDDEDFIAEFPQVAKFYNDSYSIRDIIEIVNMPTNEMVEAIKTLPSGALDNLKSIVVNQIATGSLDSVSKIKALDEIFGTDLNLVASLFE